MKRSHTQALFATLACVSIIAIFGAACERDDDDVSRGGFVDIQPSSGTRIYEQTTARGWKAYAVTKGQDEGAELHLENAGKHVLLPDAAPLGSSLDGKYLLIVWNNGLATLDMDGPDVSVAVEKPHVLVDASKTPIPGRPEDIRWYGHRLEYDAPGEHDRVTVMVDLDSKVVTTRPME